MRTLQSELNKVNGNVMAWLADKQIDEESKQKIEETLAPRCIKCGVKETRSKRAHKDGGYVLQLSLTEGLCPVCLEEEDAKA